MSESTTLVDTERGAAPYREYLEGSKGAFVDNLPAVDFPKLLREHPGFAEFHRTLGKTALMECPAPKGGASIFAKCEWENPAGSIKDRVAFGLVGDALQRHGDRPVEELHVVEYSSRNLARAVARLAQLVGIHAHLVLPAETTPDVVADLESMGAEATLLRENEKFLDLIPTSARMVADNPGWQLLFQHRNPVNVQVHEEFTGAEIVSQLAGRRPDAWLAAIGTGGTLVGVGNALAKINPAIRCIGLTPSETPYGMKAPAHTKPAFSGSGGFGWGIEQPFVAASRLAIEHRHLDRETSLRAMARFHRLTGVRIGSSAAACWVHACRLAASMTPDDCVVIAFPSAGTSQEWDICATLDDE